MKFSDFGKSIGTSFRQVLGLTHPLEPVRELVFATYSPYATRVFQSGRNGVPVNFFHSDSLIAQLTQQKSGGWQIAHTVDNDGDSQGIFINTQQMNLDDKAQHYKIVLGLEHDVVHDAQSKVDPLYNTSYHHVPGETAKIHEIKELEAYFRDLFKLTRDVVDDKIKLGDVVSALTESPRGIAHDFFSAYTGKDIRDDSEVLTALAYIVETKDRKEDIDVMPEYLYRASMNREFLYAMGRNGAEQMVKTVTRMHNWGTKQTRKEIRQPDQLLKRHFDLPDAERILHRDGINYLDKMGVDENGRSKKEIFWENICSVAHDPRLEAVADKATIALKERGFDL